MTLADAFVAFACDLSQRVLRRFLRCSIAEAANDNGGAPWSC